ncbi:MAG TPA: cobamide remodeling phosphodiesterase CbiR [Anaerolineales bacterium]|nr:cobamide remodeling phosphodiesterase CbiR [Anaerolineales bacterium]
MNIHSLPFRLGTSSYIIPADILPNVQYLAGKVRDIELVLFEVDDGQNNLPSSEVLDELIRLARLYDLTYTVHLPLDLKLGADGSEQDISLVKARKVIELTRRLDPWAYILHLDGREVRDSQDEQVLHHWQDQAVRALEIVAKWAGGPEKLAVENLERYPPNFTQPVLDRVPVSRCVDIGHLWLDGVPVLPYLEKALPRTRVIHMHGIGERDHSSLSHVDPHELEPVFRMLLSTYRGVLTLEVFSEPDFLSSIEVIDRTLKHIDSTPKSTFILGGARSGKSRYAQQLAQDHGGSVLYVATATAGDEEMRVRIENHRAERPAVWRTLEAPLNAGKAIEQALVDQPADVILLDCVTLLATNVLLQLQENASEKEASDALEVEVQALLACMDSSKATWIIVSNEVGLGLVPPYPLGRIYRDALGRANQRLAASADKTILMVAGIPASISSQNKQT